MTDREIGQLVFWAFVAGLIIGGGFIHMLFLTGLMRIID